MVLGFTKTWIVDGKTINTRFEEKIKKAIKLHTIRDGVNDRWKPGNKIHFATGVRSSNYNCFKEGVCISVQKIEIDSSSGSIKVDGRGLTPHEKEELAWNDGFESCYNLYDWFEPYGMFTGKLIHWTNIKY